MKKYILTKENEIYDTDFVDGQVVIYEQKLRIENVVFGEVEEESDDIFDLIRKGDLVKYKGTIYEIFGDAYILSPRMQTETNEEVKKNITAIYKKQNRNYNCVWERE